MSKNEIADLTSALKSADWSGVSIGNKALIGAAVTGLESLETKLEDRRMLLDKIRSHLIEKDALANFGPELFEIINNRRG